MRGDDDSRLYECPRCRKRTRIQSEAQPPDCCDGTMDEVKLDQCTLADTPEHARLDGPDEPCDDGRGG